METGMLLQYAKEVDNQISTYQSTTQYNYKSFQIEVSLLETLGFTTLETLVIKQFHLILIQQTKN